MDEELVNRLIDAIKDLRSGLESADRRYRNREANLDSRIKELGDATTGLKNKIDELATSVGNLDKSMTNIQQAADDVSDASKQVSRSVSEQVSENASKVANKQAHTAAASQKESSGKDGAEKVEVEVVVRQEPPAENERPATSEEKQEPEEPPSRRRRTLYEPDVTKIYSDILEQIRDAIILSSNISTAESQSVAQVMESGEVVEQVGGQARIRSLGDAIRDLNIADIAISRSSTEMVRNLAAANSFFNNIMFGLARRFKTSTISETMLSMMRTVIADLGNNKEAIEAFREIVRFGPGGQLDSILSIRDQEERDRQIAKLINTIAEKVYGGRLTGETDEERSLDAIKQFPALKVIHDAIRETGNEIVKIEQNRLQTILDLYNNKYVKYLETGLKVFRTSFDNTIGQLISTITDYGTTLSDAWVFLKTSQDLLSTSIMTPTELLLSELVPVVNGMQAMSSSLEAIDNATRMTGMNLTTLFEDAENPFIAAAKELRAAYVEGRDETDIPYYTMQMFKDQQEVRLILMARFREMTEMLSYSNLIDTTYFRQTESWLQIVAANTGKTVTELVRINNSLAKSIAESVAVGVLDPAIAASVERVGTAIGAQSPELMRLIARLAESRDEGMFLRDNQQLVREAAIAGRLDTLLEVRRILLDRGLDDDRKTNMIVQTLREGFADTDLSSLPKDMAPAIREIVLEVTKLRGISPEQATESLLYRMYTAFMSWMDAVGKPIANAISLLVGGAHIAAIIANTVALNRLTATLMGGGIGGLLGRGLRGGLRRVVSRVGALAATSTTAITNTVRNFGAAISTVSSGMNRITSIFGRGMTSILRTANMTMQAGIGAAAGFGKTALATGLGAATGLGKTALAAGRGIMSGIKTIARFIPGISAISGAALAINELIQGNYLRAGAYGLSSLASFIPGAGGFISGGIQTALALSPGFLARQDGNANTVSVPSGYTPTAFTDADTEETKQKLLSVLEDLKTINARSLELEKEIAENTRKDLLTGNERPMSFKIEPPAKPYGGWSIFE